MFAEDLSLFFSADEHAHQGQLAGVAVAGIFDSGYREALGGIAAQDPTYTLPSSSMGAADVGSPLSVEGQGAFVVAAIEPDGTGVTVLRLQKSA